MSGTYLAQPLMQSNHGSVLLVSFEFFHSKYPRLYKLILMLLRYSLCKPFSCSSDSKISLFVTTIALLSASIFSIVSLALGQQFVVSRTQDADSSRNDTIIFSRAYTNELVTPALHTNDPIRNAAESAGILAAVIGSATIIVLICLWPIKLKPSGNMSQKSIYILLFSIVLFAQIGATVLMLRTRFCKHQGGCKLGIGGICSVIASTLWSIGTIAIVFTSVPNSKVVPAIPTNNDIEEGER